MKNFWLKYKNARLISQHLQIEFSGEHFDESGEPSLTNISGAK